MITKPYWFALLLAGVAALAPAQDPPPATEPPPAEAPAAPAEPAAPGDSSADTTSDAPRSRGSGDPLVVIGDAVTVRAGETVDGLVVINGRVTFAGRSTDDVVLINSTGTLTGEVEGDTVIILSRVRIEGRHNGDAVGIMSRLDFGTNAVVTGDTTLVGTPAEIPEGAQVNALPVNVNFGPLNHVLDAGHGYVTRGLFWLRPFPPGVGLAWAVVLVFLALRLITAAALAGPTRFTANLVATQPLRCFVVGLLTPVLLIVALLLLMILTAGLGGVIVPFVLLAVVGLSFFGRTAVFAALGGGLGRMPALAFFGHPVPATLAGSAMVYLAYMVPIAGGVLFFVLFPFALGAGVLAVFAAFRRERPAAPSSGPLPGAPATPAPGVPAPATLSAAAGFGPGVARAPSADASEPPPASPTPLPPFPAPPPVFDSAELLSQARAGFWPRLGAALIDMVVVAVLNGLTFGYARTFWLLLAAYHVGFWLWRGTTPGGIILGLRLIRTDGRLITWQVAVVRALSAMISLLPAGLGFLWVIWDVERQSWHDRIAGTTIVKTRRPQSLV
ncbi:MAG: RDD family protein [Limisphaerales bacterium]